MTEQNQINNIDRMLKKIWDNFSLHPTEIYLSESGLKKVTEKVLGRKMSMIEFRRTLHQKIPKPLFRQKTKERMRLMGRFWV